MPKIKEQKATSSEEMLEKIYTIILHNDDYNSFEHVIECLMKFCGHEYDQATQCSYIVHFKGKCDVKRGEKGKMMKIWNSLTASNLTATIEIDVT